MSGPVGSSTWFGRPGYDLDQSLRFDDGKKGHLSRNNPTDGDRQKFTWSAWIKLGQLGTNRVPFGAFESSNRDEIRINSDDKFQVFLADAGDANLITNRLFRDTSAWYHFVVAVDTTLGTANNRIRIYVNGVEETSFGTRANPDQNYNMDFTADCVHKVGMEGDGVSLPFDGYMAEMHFLDGSALGPENFGATNENEAWSPIEYAGAYGTNGFYLPFKQDYTVEGFSAIAYTGNGVTLHVGGAGFQPDFVWIKDRGLNDNATYNHALYDSIRGPLKHLRPDNTGVEGNQANSLISFDTDGFTLGLHVGQNTGAEAHIAWCFDMGGSNANNTTGDEDSVVRANPTYGQSIVSWEATGSATTVGHGLSSAPEFMILKSRDQNGTNWMVYYGDNTDYLKLNTDAATIDAVELWNDTSPTSSVFSLGGNGGDSNNTNGGSMIAYCFHSVTGYSKFATYAGNGSATGATQTCGFRPAFVMIKRINGSGDWRIWDSARNPEAGTALKHILVNATAVENTSIGIEFLDTGFRCKSADSEMNASNSNYVYMAIADNREFAYYLDQSGNNNDFTHLNLTESDIMVDSPTNNFATLNPLSMGSAGSLSEGNLLTLTFYSSDLSGVGSTFMPDSGKWYWEVRVAGANTYPYLGITSHEKINYSAAEGSFYNIAWRVDGGVESSGSSLGSITTETIPSFATGDIISFALDVDARKLWVAENNTYADSGDPANGSAENASWTLDTGITPFVMGYQAQGVGTVINFGQDSSFAGTTTAKGNTDGNGEGDFFYAPPSGFLALCTNNLPEPIVSSNHFNTVLYTGDGSSQAKTGVGFQPDFVWIKKRAGGTARNHILTDAVRGVTKCLSSSLADGDFTNTEGLTAFGTDGFTVGSYDSVNENTGTYVAWNWKSGNANTAFSESGNNPAGTHRANVAAGFSIVSYTGTGAAGTVAHGLGTAPELMIIKNRDVADPWAVYYGDNTDYFVLNTTAATADAATYWNDTSPTASVFTVNTAHNVNADGEKYIAYVFHPVEGFSKMGDYIGNNNDDGTFIYTGFKPAFIMAKEVGGSNQWHMMDNKRSPVNPVNDHLKAQGANAEDTNNAEFVLDFVSNGFKWRDADHDNQATAYWYMAFAEAPFKYATAE